MTDGMIHDTTTVGETKIIESHKVKLLGIYIDEN